MVGEHALEGIKVVELGSNISAPYCARIMADLGAEVIKVEPPSGDPARTWGPFKGGQKSTGDSGFFLYLNAGKKGVVIDLDKSEGQEQFRTLVGGADILVENSYPSTYLGSRGLDYSSLAAINPGLVLVSISPFGRTGPYRDYRGYDINSSALAGLSIVLGSPDREPLVIPFSQCDFQGAIHGAAAAMTGLLARGKTGKGQYIDVSVAEVILHSVRGMYFVAKEANVTWMRKGTRQQVSIYPTGYFPCKDGYVCIASQSPKQWKKFIKLMGDPEWAQDPELQDGFSLGVNNPDRGDEVFHPWLKQHTRKELLEIAMEHGLTMGHVNRIDEVVEDPHFVQRGFWAEVEDPGLGKMRLPGMSYRMSETPWRITGPAPRLGEHNQEFLDGKKSKDGKRTKAAVSGKNLTRPLEGYRVLDFGWNWAGPQAAQILADMGAEVIKIESRTRQDIMRLMAYLKHFFRQNNRSKMSVTVDLKQAEGVELLKRLVKISDIVLDNFSAGTMQKLGLGYETLKAVNPGIICISMSMAGQHGPQKDMKGFASIATGYAGLEGLIGYPGEGSLGLMSFGYGDVNMAIQGVFSVLAALYYRERTGKGQFVDVSQIEATIATMGEPILDYFLNRRVAEPRGNHHPALAPHGNYPSREENQWVSIAVGSEEEWKDFVAAIGSPAWAGEERFRTMDDRIQNQKDLDELVGQWTRQHTSYEATEILQRHGVAAAPVLGIEDGDADPQLESRDIKQEIDHPDYSAGTLYATPWKLSDTPGGINRITPRLGEQNEYVYKELLGISDEEFGRLVEAGVIN